jgi:predicted DNA-binding ribbon-helix-helix protein
MRSAAMKRSVVVDRHNTSISLEDEFWHGLRDIAAAHQTTIPRLLSEIESKRQGANSNLSSAIRVHVLGYYSRRFSRGGETGRRS